jgi:UDP-N-acetylmuramyl pentapeptide synthase
MHNRQFNYIHHKVSQVNLPFAGEHNVQNATAAAAFALALVFNLMIL